MSEWIISFDGANGWRALRVSGRDPHYFAHFKDAVTFCESQRGVS